MGNYQVNAYSIVVPPVGGGRAFRGISSDWIERVGDAYYAESLPKELRVAYESIGSEDHFWTPTFCDERTLRLVVDWFTSMSPALSIEVIACYSPYLHKCVGRKPWVDRRAEPLGIDVVSIGEWSLLRELQVMLGSRCQFLAENTNAEGLLLDSSKVAELVDLYRSLSIENKVEPIGDEDPRVPVEAVEVYSLCL